MSNKAQGYDSKDGWWMCTQTEDLSFKIEETINIGSGTFENEGNDEEQYETVFL
jgi:hypothetical protein